MVKKFCQKSNVVSNFLPTTNREQVKNYLLDIQFLRLKQLHVNLKIRLRSFPKFPEVYYILILCLLKY